MNIRSLIIASLVLATIPLSAPNAFALGFELGETKEQLKLKYDVKVEDHATGRFTVVLTIADEGRLGPLRSVDLEIPSKDGTHFVDLTVPLALRSVDGKREVRVHLLKELAERATIQLKTDHLDGKQLRSTWYYHVIHFDGYIKAQKK